ncbi:toxin-antitoxin system, toxin component [Streptomyces sp. NPDC101151]|uniref:toxin-antitoxin system, toxin component n=1 Tax=Streptomyces sp. NPDC101151 TaxID=3366115 RepID=UPI00382DF8BD
MGRRRGSPVHVRTAPQRTAVFPPGPADGLWPDMADRDPFVVEERAATEHRLVMLGHERWHLRADRSGHHVDGVGFGVATPAPSDDSDRSPRRRATVPPGGRRQPFRPGRGARGRGLRPAPRRQVPHLARRFGATGPDPARRRGGPHRGVARMQGPTGLTVRPQG